MDPASILGAGVLISASIFWLGSRLDARLASLTSLPKPGTSSPAGPAPRKAEIKAPAATRVVDGIPVDRRMTFDLFHRFWKPDVARRAEAECWQPLEKARTYPALTTTPGFEVSVNAAGAVTDVKPDRFQYAQSPKLFDCLARVIRTMTFPAPGKAHSGPVQADRPPRQ